MKNNFSRRSWAFGKRSNSKRITGERDPDNIKNKEVNKINKIKENYFVKEVSSDDENLEKQDKVSYDVEEIQSDNENINSQLEEQIGVEYDNYIKALEEEKAYLLQQLDEANLKISTLENKIGMLETYNNALDEKFTATETILFELQNCNTQQENAINELKNEILKLKENNEALLQGGDELIASNSELKKLIGEKKEEIEKLRKTLKELTNNYDKLKEEFNTTNDKNLDLENIFKERDNEIVSLNEKNITLQKEIIYKDAEINELKNNNESLQNMIDEWKKNINERNKYKTQKRSMSQNRLPKRIPILYEDDNDKITELIAKNEEYKKQIEELKTSLKESQDLVIKLQNQILILEDNAKESNEKLQSMNDLQDQLLAAQKRAKDLEEQYKNLKNIIVQKSDEGKERLGKIIQSEKEKIENVIEANIRTFNANVEGYKTEIDRYKTEIKGYETQLENQNNIISSSEEEFRRACEDHKTEVENYKTQLELKNQKIAELEKKLREQNNKPVVVEQGLTEQHNKDVIDNIQLENRNNNIQALPAQVLQPLPQAQVAQVVTRTLTTTTCPPGLVGIALAGINYSIYLLCIRDLIPIAIMHDFIKERVTEQITEKTVKVIMDTAIAIPISAGIAFAAVYTLNALLPELFSYTSSLEGNTLGMQ